ncbi:type II toxin-antitoxin system Phd/YefM family antitoxin [uncultured Ruegeria sp.]|uniref:type II toxin-antitoxin system Phd/YefM family antitoxin n=1 Tax=uncultured Ruegeria sp. TaxID=259304 RepID=UPI0026157765|nr:type II toxin-antitoxin system Phd/YefM family antitoxin [uncultured Ruegeria sp.]
MRCTISHARAHLGALVTRAQDPREVITLTRRGKPLAALVSIAEVNWIWHLQDDDEIK